MKAKTTSRSRSRNSNRYVVIMAGGRGERFWPMSREKRPKQLLTLLGNRSFLQQAVDRVLPLAPPERIFVITNQAQVAAVRRQLPELPRANIIGEPCGRDTCAAVALGGALVAARDPDGVFAVLPADHVIPDVRRFQRVLRAAFDVASRQPVIATIGIKPTEPATGYGYIELGEPLDGTGDDGRPGAVRFHHVRRFVEKPDLPTAQRYLKGGRHWWNAGMFVWSVSTLMQGLERHCPEVARAAAVWAGLRGERPLLSRLAEDYPCLTKISIDYALLEKADNVVVAEGDFGWDDLGAWPALARHLPPDTAGNCAVGDFLHVDAAGNIVFDARTKQRSLVAALGVKDSIIVLTDDAVLVAAKSDAQKLKQLVARLAEAGRHELL
ncbi:MAG: mannose-1-phosphate guanyltransferase [Verrucomicrobia bacterium]|nr:MAG: mannose-1-phosphate guanyltransferase [Verrucomicrobiota bacterium]